MSRLRICNKRLNRSRCRLGYMDTDGPKDPSDGAQTSHPKGQFWTEMGCPLWSKHWLYAVSCAKTAEPIEMAFGILSGLSHLANTIGPSTCGGQWFIDVHPSLLVARWRGCLEIACSRSNLRCHLRTVFLPGFHHYANLLGPFSSSPSSVVYDLSSCTCQMSFSFLWFIGSLVA